MYKASAVLRNVIESFREPDHRTYYSPGIHVDDFVLYTQDGDLMEIRTRCGCIDVLAAREGVIVPLLLFLREDMLLEQLSQLDRYS